MAKSLTSIILMCFLRGFAFPPVPTCPDVELSELCSVCARMRHRLCVGGREHYLFIAKYLKQGLEVPCLAKDEIELENLLRDRNASADRAALEPYARTLYERLASSTGDFCLVEAAELQRASCSRLAILISGHPRTMLEPIMISEYSEVLGRLKRQYAFVEIFAYLDIRNIPWLENNLRNYRGTRETMAAINEWKPLTRKDVEQALQAWQIPFQFEEHQDGKVDEETDEVFHPDFEEAGCPRIKDASRAMGVQFAKVEAATKMMKRAESVYERSFDVVVRLRPDMCVKSILNFLNFGLNHTARNTMVPFTLWDHTAIYPRWVADLYASAWRGYGAEYGCRPDSAWGNDAPDDEGTCSINETSRGEICWDGPTDVHGHLQSFGLKPVQLTCVWGWAQGRRITGCHDLK